LTGGGNKFNVTGLLDVFNYIRFKGNSGQMDARLRGHDDYIAV